MIRNSGNRSKPEAVESIDIVSSDGDGHPGAGGDDRFPAIIPLQLND